MCSCTFLFGVCATCSVMYSGYCCSMVTHMRVTQKVSHSPLRAAEWGRCRGGTICFMEKHCILCICFPWVYHSLKLAWQGNSSVLRRRKSMAYHPQLRKKCRLFLLSAVQLDWSAVTFLLMLSEFTWQKVNVCAWLPTSVWERDLFS